MVSFVKPWVIKIEGESMVSPSASFSAVFLSSDFEDVQAHASANSGKAHRCGFMTNSVAPINRACQCSLFFDCRHDFIPFH